MIHVKTVVFITIVKKVFLIGREKNQEHRVGDI